jgi:hypothetical protein
VRSLTINGWYSGKRMENDPHLVQPKSPASQAARHRQAQQRRSLAGSTEQPSKQPIPAPPTSKQATTQSIRLDLYLLPCCCRNRSRLSSENLAASREYERVGPTVNQSRIDCQLFLSNWCDCVSEQIRVIIIRVDCVAIGAEGVKGATRLQRAHPSLATGAVRDAKFLK